MSPRYAWIALRIFLDKLMEFNLKYVLNNKLAMLYIPHFLESSRGALIILLVKVADDGSDIPLTYHLDID